MATQLVPGMPGWRPDHPCFTGTKFFDFYGWRVPLLEPGLEWCALIENVKFNPYLDWTELVFYTLFWAAVWLLSQYILRRFVFRPLALRFLPVEGDKLDATPAPKAAAAAAAVAVGTASATNSTPSSPAMLRQRGTKMAPCSRDARHANCEPTMNWGPQRGGAPYSLDRADKADGLNGTDHVVPDTDDEGAAGLEGSQPDSPAEATLTHRTNGLKHENGHGASNGFAEADDLPPTNGLKHAGADDNQKARRQPRERDILKFVTACSKFVNYTTAFVTCAYVLSQMDWFHDSRLWWRHFPQIIEPLAKHYYFFYLGFYVHQMVILFWEPKLKDFYVMLTHHVVTFLLVSFSYCTGFYRIGLPIMAVHDLSDPFMEIAKVFNYCKAKVRGVALADVFFVMFAIAFFVSRLIYYPRYLLWTIWAEATVECAFCMGVWFYLSLLLTLQAMHIYWMGLISKMVVLAVMNNGVQGDVREEDD